MTGKNKENFEKWYKDKYEFCTYAYNDNGKVINQPNLLMFNTFPKPFQWGVYLEYYDSIDINIDTELIKVSDKDLYYWRLGYDYVIEGYEDSLRTMQTEALKKANEIANNIL